MFKIIAWIDRSIFEYYLWMLLQKYRISRRMACGNLNRIGLRYLSTYSRYVSAITDSRNVKLQEAMAICRACRLPKKETDRNRRVQKCSQEGIRSSAHTMKKSRGCVSCDANLILRINENFRERGIRWRGALNRSGKTYPRHVRFTSRDRFIVRPAVERGRLSTS